MFRLRLVAPLLVVGVFWGGFLMGDDKKTEKEPIIVTKRLPTNYNKLSLSQKQKNAIYKIRGKYEAEIQGLTEKINELRDKINELRDQEKADCENVLTPDQLAKYRQILLGADRKKSTDAKRTDANNKKQESESKDKKKDTVAKDKKKDKKDTEAKDKNAPVEIKK